MESSAIRTPASPMAWMCAVKPIASMAVTAAAISPGSQLGMPFQCGQSQKGSSMALVADSMTPSAKNLIVWLVTDGPPSRSTRSRAAAN